METVFRDDPSVPFYTTSLLTLKSFYSFGSCQKGCSIFTTWWSLCRFFRGVHIFTSISPELSLKCYNLLFQDVTIDLQSLEEGSQTYTGYLKDSLNMILGVRDCPVNRMTLCVTSEPEMEKCVKMKVSKKV